MGLFDRDHEVAGLVLGVLGGIEQFALTNVLLVNSTRDDVRHQEIGQHTRLPPELQNDMDAAVDIVHHLIDGILTFLARHHKRKTLDPLQLPVNRCK